MTVTILHYGTFRALGQSSVLNIEYPANVYRIKKALVEYLGPEHQTLIEESVFANATQILSDEYILEGECTLSILPPVCGG
jgi:molybdopterin converting factor small subunit